MDFREFRERYQYDATKDLQGQGGFGRVYRAHDTILDRSVALKIFFGTAPAQYDLISEIKRAIQLSHKNICRYYHAEVVRSTDGLGEEQAIQVGIMEFLEAGTIHRFLWRHPEHRHKLLRDVLEGLHYLHHHQPSIIHRDLKPPNVLVTCEDGVPEARITDFGLAKFASASGTGLSATALGTYAYMAPEQINPARFGINGKIHCNMDLWSFGAMTMELLMGRPPFGAGNPEISTGQILQAVSEGVPDEVLQQFEEPYRTVLKRCMVLQAGERAQSAAELIALLDGASPAVTRPGVAGQMETIALPTELMESHVRTQRDKFAGQLTDNGWGSAGNRSAAQTPKLLLDQPDLHLNKLPVWAWTALSILLLTMSLVAWQHFAAQPQAHAGQTPLEQAAAPADPTKQKAEPNIHSGRHEVASMPPRTGSGLIASKSATTPIPSPIPANQGARIQAVSGKSPATNGSLQTPPSTLTSPLPPATPAETERQADKLYQQKDYLHALPLYLRACTPEGGDANAAGCRQAGWMYQMGQGDRQNYLAARQLDSRACYLGDAQACNDYGVLLATGNGGAKDSAGALTYFTKACNGGFASACQSAQSARQAVQSPPGNAGTAISNAPNISSQPYGPQSVPSYTDSRTITLTPSAPVAEREAVIRAPGRELMDYNVFTIDTRDFVNGGVLEIDIQIAPDSRTDGSFDLFPANVPIPTRGRPVGTLAGRYDVRRGAATRLEYPFRFGQVFNFGLEGNWFSPQGSTGMVRFIVRVRQ